MEAAPTAGGSPPKVGVFSLHKMFKTQNVEEHCHLTAHDRSPVGVMKRIALSKSSLNTIMVVLSAMCSLPSPLDG